MKELKEAEIQVDTVFSIESGAGNANRFYLADYGSMHEFVTDCAAWFQEGESPEYVYTDWFGIPDYLINRRWLCPQIFEIRDAIQSLDDESLARFPQWCRTSGHDIATDDPHMLVTRFQDYIRPTYEPDPDTAESDDKPYIPAARIEIFDENYN